MRIHISGGVLEAEATGDPNYPDNGTPGYGRPDNGLPPGVPAIPGNLPTPPVGTWPPPSGNHPIVPAPPGTPPGVIWPSPGVDRPDNSLPGGEPGTPDQGLPSSVFWVVAGIPGVGWRYVAVDPSLSIDNAPTGPEPR